MLKPNIKYRVTLTEEEREILKRLIQKGHTAGYRIRHAQILLVLDELPANASWTDAQVAAAYESNMRSIGNLCKRFVEAGFEAALERKKRLVPPKIKIDGEAEAKISALACSEAPEGRSRWTLQLLADTVVELGILDSISDNGIRNLLNRGSRRNGVFPRHRPSLSSGWRTY
jgi:hypothetical protein